MRRSDRRYFFVIGLACAVGWQYRLWLLPLAAFALVEAAVVLAALRRAPAGAVVPLPARDGADRHRRAA